MKGPQSHRDAELLSALEKLISDRPVGVSRHELHSLIPWIRHIRPEVKSDDLCEIQIRHDLNKFLYNSATLRDHRAMNLLPAVRILLEIVSKKKLNSSPKPRDGAGGVATSPSSGAEPQQPEPGELATPTPPAMQGKESILAETVGKPKAGEGAAATEINIEQPSTPLPRPGKLKLLIHPAG